MFTIIIPCHNYGKFLINCIRSIKFDNKFLKEVIIINDNSKDNTRIIGKKLSKLNKITFINVKYNSLACTINYAVKKVKTKYFSRIDPDDTYHENFFKVLVDKNIFKNFDFVYGNVYLQSEKKIKYIKQKVSKIFKNFKHPLSNGNLMGKKKFLEINRNNKKLKFKDDYDVWLKLNNSKSKIKYINTPTFYYHRHQRNMSNNIFTKKFTYLKLLLKNKNIF